MAANKLVRICLAASLIAFSALALWMATKNDTLPSTTLPSHAESNSVVPSRVLAISVAVVVGCTGLLLALSTFDKFSNRTVLRLDWFVPAIRRSGTGSTPYTSLIGRYLRVMLPNTWLSDYRTKRRGRIRNAMRRLGRSFVASPVRRCVQAVCLTTFVALFTITCWPYSSVPDEPVVGLPGWTLAGLDQLTGNFTFENEDITTEYHQQLAHEGQVVFVPNGDPTDDAESLSFAVDESALNANAIVCAPLHELSPDDLANLLTNSEGFTSYVRDPFAWPSHYADNLARKELIPAETFLLIDPLVSLSTGIASRSWVWSLFAAGVILIVCLLIPRGFCGYICPLGTTIDLFDFLVGKRVLRFRVPDGGWWVHTKYYLLAGTLMAAICGVLVSGFFSAIPVITRAMLFLIAPLQNGFLRGWHLLPAMGPGQYLSILMFLAVLCLGFLKPRFWCKYVCPSGAVFSVANLFRVTERKVESSCINCNKCVEVCPFDAIKPDFTTRTTDCTLCQTCGGVCPTHAIKFVERWNKVELKVLNDPPTHETAIGRRGFLSLAAGTATAVVGGATVAGATKAWGANLGSSDAMPLVRPPGSVPEQEFLEMCIRCGECFKACPNDVLQPEGFQQGLEGLWTPMVKADWAGCESSCNACGQVCPTGAIRSLPIEEKRVARMGLAIVNESTCLPFAESEACDLCVQECNAAGYEAIEYTQVGTQVDDQGLPVEGSGFLAPVVLEDKCVGCGLCQTRCYAINVKDKHLLSESAIIVEAGEGKEDRLMDGSYLQLRQAEQPSTVETTPESQPDVLDIDDPFGLQTDATPPSNETEAKESPEIDEADPFGLGTQ